MRAAALVFLLALPGRADVELGARPELRLGAGYDDNLFLDAQPSGPNPDQIRSDAIIDVRPRLSGWLEARRHLLTLNVDYLERVTPSHGDLRDLALQLSWHTPPLGPVSFSAGGHYEHWDATLYPEDTFNLGGADAAVGARLGERLMLEARYRFSARGYPDRTAQLDLYHRARGTVGVRAAAWLRLEAAYTFTHIGSNVAAAELDRHRAELSILVTPLRWLSLSANYGIGPQHVPAALFGVGMSGMFINGPRNDLLQSFEVAVAAQPLPWLELFAHYSLIHSDSDDPSGHYQRNQVLAGAAVRWDFSRRWMALPPLRPRQNGASINFRFRGRPGQKVAVTGDWNGWTPQPLGEKSGGVYESTYMLPAGRHEYSFSVDGNAVEPPDAPAYVPDGFGGKSGVLTVE